MRTALTIAGSDCSGGAGIQADLKTMMANGVYAMSVITALTAQNTMGVSGIMEVTPEFLKKQLDAVFTDIKPDAVKIGMVASAELIPGRSVLGGCHAKTAGACFVLSLSVLFGCVLLPFYLTGISVWIVSFSFIILEVLLWIIAPVECKNKPFIGNQKKRCQTYSKVIILLLGALFMAFLFMKMSEYLLEIWLILVYFSATIN